MIISNYGAKSFIGCLEISLTKEKNLITFIFLILGNIIFENFIYIFLKFHFTFQVQFTLPSLVLSPLTSSSPPTPHLFLPMGKGSHVIWEVLLYLLVNE